MRVLVKMFVSTIVLVGIISLVRVFVQARYCPSGAMEPTIKIEDRFLTESLSVFTNNLKRGDIVLFYPPKVECPNIDDVNVSTMLGDITGLPMFPCRPVFIKRIIGLPGDQIEIKPGSGVLVNGKELTEPYAPLKAQAALKTMGDIGGKVGSGIDFHPYPGSLEPIRVPENMLFMLGDNRPNSQDSRAFGFVKRDRVVGKAWLMMTSSGLSPIN